MVFFFFAGGPFFGFDLVWFGICLDDEPIGERGVLKSPTTAVLGLICGLLSTNICVCGTGCSQV